MIGVSSCKPNCARAPCRQLHWLLSCDDEAKWKCSGKKKTNSNSAAQVRRLTIFAVLTPETSMGINLIKGVCLVNLKRSQTRAVLLPESLKRHGIPTGSIQSAAIMTFNGFGSSDNSYDIVLPCRMDDLIAVRLEAGVCRHTEEWHSSDLRILTPFLPRIAPSILPSLIAERLGLAKSHLATLARD